MTRKVTVAPTLIVGLGGTGSLALQYVKQKIRSRLESHKISELPEQIPFIEYLVLDTILPEDNLEKFVPDEFMDIGRVNISRVRESLESGSDEKILNWFPRHLDPGQIDSGAGGVRAIGRLCFFLNEWRIEERIRDKVKQITNSAHIQNFLTEYLPTIEFSEATTIDVHFVSSLCGGTGSACLLDTAYLVQHIIIEDTKQVPKSVAHLVTTEPFEGEAGIGRSSREYIQQNFAISLSEIEHFNSQGSWEVQYRNGTNVRSGSKPFSIAYLLGYKDGVSLSRTQICEIIGETIAIKSVHHEGKRIKGSIENHKPHVINTEDANHKLKTYSSYNTQILKTDVDANMFEVGVLAAQKMVLSSLCTTPVDDGKETFTRFEQQIFAATSDIARLDFQALADHARSQLGIRSHLFDDAAMAARHTIRESPRKRRKHSEAASLRVNQACESANQLIRTNQQTLISSFNRVFEELATRTDEEINKLLGRHGLDHVSRLLARISSRLTEIRNDLQTSSIPDTRNYRDEITREIVEGRSGSIATICKERAESEAVSTVFERLGRHIDSFQRLVDERRAWCDEARAFLLRVDELLPKPVNHGRPSHTINSIWTVAQLLDTVTGAKQEFVGRFMKLLEREYFRNDLNPKICFLPFLNISNGSRESVRRILEISCRETVGAEIEHYQSLMQQKAAEKMHEFVDFASPAWQIEKTGEDIATVSITNCPEHSVAGRIMSRIGKNISFSRNGVDPQEQREIILFSSEHGASINHLSNFKRCLDAVGRKMQMESKERLADLCLDRNWNVPPPLPLRVEELRLDFTLGLYFTLIKVEGFEYYFENNAGEKVLLRQNPDKSKATRRFEAFGKLLEFDSNDSEASKYLAGLVIRGRSKNEQKDQIRNFRAELLRLDESLQAMSRNPGLRAPDEIQLRKEAERLAMYIDELNVTINAMENTAMPPPISPAIVIGVGPSAEYILNRAQELIKLRLGFDNLPPIFEFITMEDGADAGRLISRAYARVTNRRSALISLENIGLTVLPSRVESYIVAPLDIDHLESTLQIARTLKRTWRGAMSGGRNAVFLISESVPERTASRLGAAETIDSEVKNNVLFNRCYFVDQIDEFGKSIEFQDSIELVARFISLALASELSPSIRVFPPLYFGEGLHHNAYASFSCSNLKFDSTKLVESCSEYLARDIRRQVFTDGGADNVEDELAASARSWFAESLEKPLDEPQNIEINDLNSDEDFCLTKQRLDEFTLEASRALFPRAKAYLRILDFCLENATIALESHANEMKKTRKAINEFEVKKLLGIPTGQKPEAGSPRETTKVNWSLVSLCFVGALAFIAMAVLIDGQMFLQIGSAALAVSLIIVAFVLIRGKTVLIPTEVFRVVSSWDKQLSDEKEKYRRQRKKQHIHLNLFAYLDLARVNLADLLNRPFATREEEKCGVFDLDFLDEEITKEFYDRQYDTRSADINSFVEKLGLKRIHEAMFSQFQVKLFNSLQEYCSGCLARFRSYDLEKAIRLRRSLNGHRPLLDISTPSWHPLNADTDKVVLAITGDDSNGMRTLLRNTFGDNKIQFFDSKDRFVTTLVQIAYGQEMKNILHDASADLPEGLAAKKATT